MRDDLEAMHIVVKAELKNPNDPKSDCEWWAKCHWQDSRFCESGTVEGDIYLRYAEETLSIAIDAIIEVLETFKLNLSGNFMLLYEDDGEDIYTPMGWKELLQVEACKRGWQSYMNPNPSKKVSSQYRNMINLMNQ